MIHKQKSDVHMLLSEKFIIVTYIVRYSLLVEVSQMQLWDVNVGRKGGDAH